MAARDRSRSPHDSRRADQRFLALRQQIIDALLASNISDSSSKSVIQELSCMAKQFKEKGMDLEGLRAAGMGALAQALLLPKEDVVPADETHHDEQDQGCVGDALAIASALAQASQASGHEAQRLTTALFALSAVAQFIGFPEEATEELQRRLSRALESRAEACVVCKGRAEAEDRLMVASCGHALHHGCFVRSLLARGASHGQCPGCQLSFRWHPVVQAISSIGAVRTIADCLEKALTTLDDSSESSSTTAAAQSVCLVGAAKSLAHLCEAHALGIWGDAERRHTLWDTVQECLEDSEAELPESLAQATQICLDHGDVNAALQLLTNEGAADAAKAA